MTLAYSLLVALSVALPASAQQTTALEEQKLVPADVAVFDFFGYSVDLLGDTAVVGAYWHDVAATDSGSVYVWQHVGDTWVERVKLSATDGAMWDNLGRSVALDHGTIASGAPSQDTSGLNAGAVYVFEGGGTSWTQVAKLLANDGDDTDFLGGAVALDGGTLAAGAVGSDTLGNSAGAAYVFIRGVGGWSQQAKLLAGDGTSGDDFGHGLTIQGDTLAIGAPLADGVTPASGAVYVFVRDGMTWAQQAKLMPADGAPLDRFGESLSLAGDTLAISARRDDDLGSASGSAYIWRRNGTAWSPTAKLHASDASPDALFGSWVSLEVDHSGQGRLAVGARGADGAQPASGAAYVFEGAGTFWTETVKLVAHDGESGDLAGWEVALSGNHVLVGAHRDDDARPTDPGAQSGAAYVWRLLPGDPGGAVACVGDGTGASCPCGNDSSVSGAGCLHSGGVGISISAAGSASLAADDLVLIASDCPPGNTGVFVAGLTLDPPAPLTDGLRCAGGATHTYRGRWQAHGVASDEGLIAQQGGSPFLQPGATAHFQYWSRDAHALSPCGASANLSPAYSLIMAP